MRSAAMVRCLCGLLWMLYESAVACAEPAAGGSRIYRCRLEGVTIFADRPCAASAEPYVADTSRINTYDPVAASSGPAHAAVRPRARNAPTASAAPDQARQRAACEQTRRALKALRARMRAGYGAREGARLQERYASLQARWRAQRCR